MSRTPHTLPPAVITLFMVIGLLSAVAFRALTILARLYPPAFRPVWYGGVIGYVLFFAYRYAISEKRKRAIREHRLLEKVQSGQPLSDQDRELIGYVLASITKSRENINYLFIFVLSLIAIVVDLVLAGLGG